jgi:hypothetical protein
MIALEQDTYYLSKFTISCPPRLVSSAAAGRSIIDLAVVPFGVPVFGILADLGIPDFPDPILPPAIPPNPLDAFAPGLALFALGLAPFHLGSADDLMEFGSGCPLNPAAIKFAELDWYGFETYFRWFSNPPPAGSHTCHHQQIDQPLPGSHSPDRPAHNSRSALPAAAAGRPQSCP